MHVICLRNCRNGNKPVLPKVPIKVGASLGLPVIYPKNSDKSDILASDNPVILLRNDTDGTDANAWKVFLSVLTPEMDADVHALNIFVGGRQIVSNI